MRIKICCLKTKSELFNVLDEGVDCVGFVSRMPSGPGIISDDQIRRLVQYTSKDIDTFLLTSFTNPHDIAEQLDYIRTTTIQLCNPMPLEDILTLRKLLPDISIVNVIHIEDEFACSRASDIEAASDGILLDSGCINGTPQKLGGTGMTHNWEISRAIAARCSKTTWLAGGLTAENVCAAIDTVMPSGVDVCSGIRTNDKLDNKKLRQFLERAGSWYNGNDK